MKAPALVLVSAAVAGATAILATWVLDSVRTPAPPPAPPPAAPAPSPELARRVDRLEARLGELAASLEALRAEEAAARAEEAKRDAARKAEDEKRAGAVEAITAAALGGAPGDEAKKPEGLDAIAKAASKEIRRSLGQQFRRIADLVTNPTPEALDARRRELRFFAGVVGAQAGLDRAQVATLERILDDTDEKAREDLRPILQGVDDYRKVDYGKVRQLTDASFSAQNDQFDREFPRDKADAVKAQLEPVRNMFGAMIDTLEKESKAAADAGAPK
jgi:hypothetical protein